MTNIQSSICISNRTYIGIIRIMIRCDPFLSLTSIFYSEPKIPFLYACFIFCVLKQTFNGDFFFPFRFVWIFRLSDKIDYPFYNLSWSRLYRSVVFIYLRLLVFGIHWKSQKDLSWTIILTNCFVYSGNLSRSETCGWSMVNFGHMRNFN